MPVTTVEADPVAVDRAAGPLITHPPAPGAAAAPGAPAIAAHGLTKRYGARAAVNAVTFEVPRGVVAGFVGPNGSGKTTTIRMLLGLIGPSAGTATVLGHSIADGRDYLPRVGALIEGPAFYPTLSGRRNLAVLATLGGYPRERIAEVLATVGLTDRAGDLVKTYSMGMKQRLGIAAALLPRPELLILDEPANGLDPAGILEMRRLLRMLCAQGVTVFVSSHLLAEVEQISDWVVVLLDGRLIASGSVSDVLSGGTTTVAVACEEPEGLAVVEGVARRLQLASTVVDGRLHIEAGPEMAGLINRLSMEGGVTLTEIAVHRPTLEATFLEITGGVSR